MGAVTLNVDLGEMEGEPEELYRLATVVNIACGGHAGDDASMARAIDLAIANGAEIAAHPSYPDRPNFGRATMAIAPGDLGEAIAAQCAALQRIATARGAGRIRAVKLHGALYHDASRDPAIAEAVMEGAARGLGRDDVVWIGPSRGEVWTRAQARGLGYVREGFADRGTLPDGSLVPRGRPGALIEDPDRAAEQAIALAKSGDVDSLCVHSDTPGAVTIARAVRRALESNALLRSGGKAEGDASGGEGDAPGGEGDAPSRLHTIDVVYDGPDLDDVARALGVTKADVIAMHTGREHPVQIIGFLPGFAYMGPVDPRLVLPRRGAPRPRVEPQSVAIAGPYTGIYPIASPGGWNLIGRSVGPLPFDPSREEPFLFAPGDRVRFRAAEASDAPISKKETSTRAASATGDAAPREDIGTSDDTAAPERPALVLARAAGIATIQDAGRFGFLSRGVPPSGPLDPELFDAANRALANDRDAAAIELCAGSLVVRARGGVTISIDGEPPITLADGEEIRVGEGERAVRYVAVRGGVDVPSLLGSRSTLLSARIGGLEGRVLRKDDVLGVGSGGRPLESRSGGPHPDVALPAGQEESEIWIDVGPHLARFPEGAFDVLLRSEWRVSRLVDRTGMRLEGASIPRSGGDVGAPTPMRRGAIQVTTDGTPIVLGPDHPTTGGYPVIATVRGECFGRLARRRPGEGVRFRLLAGRGQ
ncbi:MAG: LamB/YcsF family protein [Polyangiaceae bacterium]